MKYFKKKSKKLPAAFNRALCYAPPPFWFCMLVTKDQILLSDWNTPDSFDGYGLLLLKFLATPLTARIRAYC